MVNIMGREIPTPVLLVGGAIGIGGFFWYRHNKANQATTQTQNTPPTDPSIDPNTGVPYSQEYGAFTYAPSGAGYGPDGLGDYSGGYSGGVGGYYGGGYPAPVPQQAATNAQWSEAAVSALTAQGYNGMQVLAALGLYLTGGQLSSDQASIVQAAIAAEGYPPNPPSGGIVTSPPNGPPGPANQNNVIVPNVKGTNVSEAAQVIKSVGLVPRGKKTSRVAICKGTSPAAGASVPKGSNVTILS